MTAATATRWKLKGQGYEFCNCDFGCGCNFGGFPNSEDGSCRAFVGLNITRGACGDVDLSGVKCGGVYAWPKAIHEGNGKVAFVVDSATTDKQVEALAQIFTGKLGGMPWEILGPTAEVVGLVKAKITIEGSGRKSAFRAEGVGEGRGDTLSTCRTASSGRRVSAARARSVPPRVGCRWRRRRRTGSSTSSTGPTGRPGFGGLKPIGTT